jgi:hypothetical protein
LIALSSIKLGYRVGFRQAGAGGHRCFRLLYYAVFPAAVLPQVASMTLSDLVLSFVDDSGELVNGGVVHQLNIENISQHFT